MATAEGFKAVRLFDEVERGTIKALWIMHTNPAVSLPKADRVREALRGLDLLVVSEATASTDTLSSVPRRGLCLLPAAAWGEKNGTVTNSERRISRQRPFLPPPGEARPDWWMAAEVGRRMGFAGFAYPGPADVFREHAALSAFENGGTRPFDLGGLASLTDEAYDYLAPVQWPVRAGEMFGPARLFAGGGFATPDGRARLIAIAPPDEIEPYADFPFRLNTGRMRDHWHTMTRTGLSPRLARHTPEPFVEMHPADAAAYGLGDGDHAEVRTRRGRATLRVRLTPGARGGTLFAPIHWNDATAGLARIGALVHDLVDPVSGQPDSKASPAAIARAPMRAHGFLLARDIRDLPRRLSHARLAVRGGMACLFASPDGPEELHARLGNWLPGGAQRLELTDVERGLHRTVMIEGNRLAAALFVAPARDEAAFERCLALFERDEPLAPTDRAGLLAGRAGSGAADASSVVCSCHGVRRARIEAAAAAGARTLEAVGAACAAGTNCGSCRPEIKGILHAAQPSLAVTRAA
jgi:assimilatory nitrate reductase catalytic subunit